MVAGIVPPLHGDFSINLRVRPLLSRHTFPPGIVWVYETAVLLVSCELVTHLRGIWWLTITTIGGESNKFH